MTEDRKQAILFAATLLCARKMIEIMDSDKPNFASSISWIRRLMRRRLFWSVLTRSGPIADKNPMPKVIGQCLLFKYINGEFKPLSRPFKTKAAAEKARLKLPERERREVAVGVIRTKR